MGQADQAVGPFSLSSSAAARGGTKPVGGGGAHPQTQKRCSEPTDHQLAGDKAGSDSDASQPLPLAANALSLTFDTPRHSPHAVPLTPSVDGTTAPYCTTFACYHFVFFSFRLAICMLYAVSARHVLNYCKFKCKILLQQRDNTGQ